MKIPVYQPALGEQEKQNVMECLETNWISSRGRFVSMFEQSFAEFIGVRHAASVCNGTVALHLALEALGIQSGDEVIVPSFTYVASVNSIKYTGANPVFVDSLPTTWQIDPEDIERKLTPRTKAIMAVHLYGHPCDMKRIVDIAKKHGLLLVEDCAEAIGSCYGKQKVGVFGDIATFSFFGNKTITTGEGGMVVTNDQRLHDRVCHLKGQGLAAHREYWHDVVGYNYRMTNICAAIGYGQLGRVEKTIQKKRQIADYYFQNLKGLPVEMLREEGPVFNTYWMVSIAVKDAARRDPLRDYLKNRGIETRPAFYPAHTMPIYDKRFEKHPVAESLASRGINLPSWPELTEENLKTICDSIREFFVKA